MPEIALWVSTNGALAYFWACSKCRGISPEATARHRGRTTVPTDYSQPPFPPFPAFFPLFLGSGFFLILKSDLNQCPIGKRGDVRSQEKWKKLSDLESDAWDVRSPKTWKMMGKKLAICVNITSALRHHVSTLPCVNITLACVSTLSSVLTMVCVHIIICPHYDDDDCFYYFQK